VGGEPLAEAALISYMNRAPEQPWIAKPVITK